MIKSKVSIIIPAYNCAEYITDAIDSILSQTYKNYEIIVIDDGSTDNTKETLKQYKNKINYIYQENQGVSAARNHGITKAQGELIAFLDADDSWFPDKLNNQLYVLSQNPDCISVFSNFHIINAENSITFKNGISEDYAIFKSRKRNYQDLFDSYNEGIYSGNIFKSLLSGNFINTCSLLIKKEAIDKCGFFNTELITQEDYDYWLRLSSLGKFLYIEVPLLNRRKRPGQLTGQDKKLQIAKDVVSVIEKHSKTKLNTLKSNDLKSRLREVYKMLALNYLAVRDCDSARKTLLKSLKVSGFSIKIIFFLIWSFIPNSISVYIRKKFMPLFHS